LDDEPREGSGLRKEKAVDGVDGKNELGFRVEPPACGARGPGRADIGDLLSEIADPAYY
jgi:hypothetical protein